MIELPAKAYCNNTRQDCDAKEAISRPDGTCLFLAHPFDERTREWANELKETLSGYGIKSTLPIDSRNTDVLFCKICAQIRSCSAIVSEMTTLNRNVIFEHGFALAIGCRGVIARDKTRRVDSLLDVLDDIERIDYENSDDLAVAIAELAANDKLSLSYDMCGNALFLSDWDLEQFQEKHQLCFIKAGQQNTDSVRRIEKILRASRLPDVTIDTEEHTSHKLYYYAKTIKESFAVVGHFVTDRNVDHQRINALTAMLLGMAAGFGKRICILQQMPIERQMIDVGGVRRTYTKLAELEQALLDHIASWKEEIERLRGPALAMAMHANVVRAVLEIGSPAAESDEMLGTSFIHTQYASWARDCSRFIISGPKGAGKTAIYRWLEGEQQKPKERSIFLELRNLEVERILEFIESNREALNRQLLFRAFWRSNLLIEIAGEFLEQTGGTRRNDEDYKALQAWHYNLGLEPEMDYYDRFEAVLGGRDASVTNANLQAMRFTVVEKLLQNLLVGWQIKIYVDRLDESWKPNMDDQQELLRTFVHECFTMSNNLQGVVKPVLFLRQDILNELKIGLQEADKWNTGTIEWSRAELSELLETRVKSRILDNSKIESIWNSVLPQTVKGQKSVDYLLDRTLMRPRDAITLLQSVIQCAQSEGGPPATEDAIERALSSYSAERLTNLQNEYVGEWPELLHYFRSIESCFVSDWKSSEEELDRAATKAKLPPKYLKVLYEAGIICFLDQEGRLITSLNTQFDRALLIGAVEVRKIETVTKLWWFFKKRGTHQTEHRRVALRPAFHGIFSHLTEQVRFATGSSSV